MNVVWEENEQNCVVCVKMIYISTYTNTCINKYLYIYTQIYKNIREQYKNIVCFHFEFDSKECSKRIKWDTRQIHFHKRS